LSPSTRFGEIADETCKTLKLPTGIVEMMIGNSEVNEYPTMSEMEIESGIRLKYRINVIGNIFGREMFKREVNLLENKTRINEFQSPNYVESKQN
jgi:hypothetical protein